jgi:hypothetical protein
VTTEGTEGTSPETEGFDGTSTIPFNEVELEVDIDDVGRDGIVVDVEECLANAAETNTARSSSVIEGTTMGTMDEEAAIVVPVNMLAVFEM